MVMSYCVVYEVKVQPVLILPNQCARMPYVLGTASLPRCCFCSLTLLGSLT